MKIGIIALALIAGSAGMASADVKLSGFGRWSVTYTEDGTLTGGGNDVFLQSRIRLEFDASTKADNGMKFGGKIWFQEDHNSTGTVLSPAVFYVESGSWTFETGNVLTAFDGAYLLKQTRLGVHAVSVGGDPLGDFFQIAYRTYGNLPNRQGFALDYATQNFDARISAVDPDQYGNGPHGPRTAEEIAASIYYKLDNWEFSAATAQNGGGLPDNDLYFAGTRYRFGNGMRVGLNFNDNGTPELGNSYTLYGDYKMGDITFAYYAAYNDGDWSAKRTDGSYGVAVKYDLGGNVFIATSLQRDYDGIILADMGVRFDF